MISAPIIAIHAVAAITNILEVAVSCRVDSELAETIVETIQRKIRCFFCLASSIPRRL